MTVIGNLTIIGTSHISKNSVSAIKAFIEDEKPDIVAVELDRGRLSQLFSEEKERLHLSSVFHVGIKGFMFAVIGRYAQKKLGDIVGVKPGSDMKTAIMLAKKHNLQLALIDQDIRITLSRFSKAFGWKEKWSLIKDVVSAFFKKDKVIQFDLKKVPSKTIIKRLLSEVKSKYPGLYQVLVEERNHVMVRNLKKLMTQNPDKKILAVIGAGHEEGMIELLQSQPKISYSYSFETVA